MDQDTSDTPQDPSEDDDGVKNECLRGNWGLGPRPRPENVNKEDVEVEMKEKVTSDAPKILTLLVYHAMEFIINFFMTVG